MKINVKDQERAYRFYMEHSAEAVLAHLRAGSDPALEQLVLDAIRSKALVAPAGPGNVARELEREPISGKEAVEELVAGEWEILSNVVFHPGERRMDQPTFTYFRRYVECALFLLQNIQVLRGGEPNFYWSDISDPAAFWAEYDRWIESLQHFIDPVTAHYEKMSGKSE